MEAELAALAASGATTLVSLMTSDAWSATKARVRTMLGGGPGRTEPVEDELEEWHRELTTARDSGDEAAIAAIEAMWQTWLCHVLQKDPAAADALRGLIAERSPAKETVKTVHNTITGGDLHGPVIQTGTIKGDVHFG
jgi:hypothetical protein